MKKKALITGIGGQDGSYLAEFLLKKNYDVYGILPRRSSPELQILRIENTLSKINLSYGDILDKSNIERLNRICFFSDAIKLRKYEDLSKQKNNKELTVDLKYIEKLLYKYIQIT